MAAQAPGSLGDRGKRPDLWPHQITVWARIVGDIIAAPSERVRDATHGVAMSEDSSQSRCPGCGLVMPAGNPIPYDGYFNASVECWSLFTEVIGREFSNAV